MDAGTFAVATSAIAIVVSLASLWVTSLAPFRLRVSHDTPTFAVYKITDKESDLAEPDQTWWIPSFDVPFSLYNAGRQPGEVLDFRIVAEMGGARGKQSRTEVFYPMWIVNYAEFQRSRQRRFEWLGSAVLRDWYPLPLVGQGEAHIHVIFENFRWEEKFVDEMSLKLQVICSPDNRWITLGRYELEVPDFAYDGSSCTPRNLRRERLRARG